MYNTVWLVDMGYVSKAYMGKFKLDYVEAECLLEQHCGPTRTYLFNGFDPEYGIPEGLQAFYDAMELHGMRVRVHPMQSGPRGMNQQRRVDVDLSAHLVWQASLPHVQVLVLTTGDQDFIPAVELVRREFKKVVVLFTYSTSVHPDLAKCVDKWWGFEFVEGKLAWRR